MKSISRRGFLGSLAAGAALGMGKAEAMSLKGIFSKKEPPVGMIHVTDLYRPHVDPDDHWDLASVFALGYRGDVDLKMVLIDYPVGRVVEMFGKRNPNPPLRL